MSEPADMMPIDEAVEMLRSVTRRPAGGVVWSRRELAERAALAEIARLRAQTDEEFADTDRPFAHLDVPRVEPRGVRGVDWMD